MATFCFFLVVGVYCPGKNAVAADSFCKVYQQAVRNELRLTDRELAGLRSGTKGDLAALKRTYERKCTKQ